MLGSAGRARLRYAREGGGGGRQLGRVLNDECANERRVGPTRSSSRTGGTYRLSRRPACIGGPIAPLAGPGRHTSRWVRRLSRPQSVSKDLHPPAEAPRSQNFNDRFQQSSPGKINRKYPSVRSGAGRIARWWRRYRNGARSTRRTCRTPRRTPTPTPTSHRARYPTSPRAGSGVRSASSEGPRLPRWRPAPRGPPRSLRRGR